MSIAAMVLGILCIPLGFVACAGGWAVLPLLLGIAGVVLSALGMMREPDKKGMAIAGLVCAIVGLVVTLICFACTGCAVCRYGSALNQFADELSRELQNMNY